MPARLGGDVRRTQFLRQVQRPLRVLAADRPIVRIRIGPAGMPIRLPRIGHGVHHEGVDVRNRQPVLIERLANRLLPLRQQPRRPGMRHVGQQLDARVPRRRHAGNRLLDRKVHVGVGTEGKLHRTSIQ